MMVKVDLSKMKQASKLIELANKESLMIIKIETLHLGWIYITLRIGTIPKRNEITEFIECKHIEIVVKISDNWSNEDIIRKLKDEKIKY